MESVRNALPTGAIWTLVVVQLLFGPGVCELPIWGVEETSHFVSQKIVNN